MSVPITRRIMITMTKHITSIGWIHDVASLARTRSFKLIVNSNCAHHHHFSNHVLCVLYLLTDIPLAIRNSSVLFTRFIASICTTAASIINESIFFHGFFSEAKRNIFEKICFSTKQWLLFAVLRLIINGLCSHVGNELRYECYYNQLGGLRVAKSVTLWSKEKVI